jgi:hypothetical protein
MANKIKVYRGDDVSLTFTVKDENGDAVDITNDTIFFTVKAAKNATAAGSADLTAIIKKDNGPGEHSDPTNGRTAFSLSHAETAVTPGLYYYDIQWVTASNEVTTFTVDEFEVLKEVTTDIA